MSKLCFNVVVVYEGDNFLLWSQLFNYVAKAYKKVNWTEYMSYVLLQRILQRVFLPINTNRIRPL